MQVMLILILIDVKYSQKAGFSFEKGLNDQNHSSSGSYHLVKKIPPGKICNSSSTTYRYLENSDFYWLNCFLNGVIVPIYCFQQTLQVIRDTFHIDRCNQN